MLTRDVIKRADLILTMSRHHRARIQELDAGARVYLLGEYAGRSGDDAEVADPFGADLETYRETFAQLDVLIRLAAGRLATEDDAESQGN